LRALLYSIPGSGTRFACKYLTEVLGYKKYAVSEFSEMPVTSRSLTQCHVDGSFMSARARGDNLVHHKLRAVADEGLIVVIPLRSPVATAISRMRDDGGRSVLQIREMWKTLAGEIDSFDHILLPVEAPWLDHRRLLKLVASKLDAVPDPVLFEEMAAKWPRIGSSGLKGERDEYARTGRTTLGGHDSSIFDEATAWYIRRLAHFAGGEYMQTPIDN
jgi:hypothetical protein